MAWWDDALSGLWGGIAPYATDPLAWLGAAGTGVGIYDIIRRNQIEKDYLRRQRNWMSKVESTANAPLNIEAIFNPGKALIQRDLESGLAERGLQPGGAWSAAMGEGMMRKWLDAAQIAQAQRGNQVGALASMSPAHPAFPAAGDTSSLGKYLQYVRQQRSIDAARNEQAGMYRDMMKALSNQPKPWYAPATPPLTQSFNPYPDMPQEPGDNWY